MTPHSEVEVREIHMGPWDFLCYKVFEVLKIYMFNRSTGESLVWDSTGSIHQATEGDEDDFARIDSIST